MCIWAFIINVLLNIEDFFKRPVRQRLSALHQSYRSTYLISLGKRVQVFTFLLKNPAWSDQLPVYTPSWSDWQTIFTSFQCQQIYNLCGSLRIIQTHRQVVFTGIAMQYYCLTGYGFHSELGLLSVWNFSDSHQVFFWLISFLPMQKPCKMVSNPGCSLLPSCLPVFLGQTPN